MRYTSPTIPNVSPNSLRDTLIKPSKVCSYRSGNQEIWKHNVMKTDVWVNICSNYYSSIPRNADRQNPTFEHPNDCSEGKNGKKSWFFRAPPNHEISIIKIFINVHEKLLDRLDLLEFKALPTLLENEQVSWSNSDKSIFGVTCLWYVYGNVYQKPWFP